jgi:1-acyl-sn-glycerol-3-phosphate acyltransferase
MGESRDYNLVRQTLGRAPHLCFRPRYRGQESVPIDGPLILAANHLSHIDPAFIMTATSREVSYLSKQEHFEGRIRGALFGRMGVIPVDRDGDASDALDAAEVILRDGGAVGIFPEGTRSRDGQLGRGRTGAARLAAATGAAVVPVAIRETDRVIPVGKRVPRLWRRFYYEFGDPLYFTAKEANREALREFTDEIMDAITALSEKAGDYWHSRRLRTRMAAWQERNGLGRAKLRASLDARAQALRARLGR